MHATAREILAQAATSKCRIVLPVDAVVASEFKPNPPTETVSVDAVPADMMVLDVGPASAKALTDLLPTLKTLVWNGPLGAFETPPFDAATTTLAKAVAEATAAGKLRRCWRRRYGLGAPSCRRHRQNELRVDRRRCVPGVAGG